MSLYSDYLVFEKNRTNKLVHWDLRFFNTPMKAALRNFYPFHPFHPLTDPLV
jgi:hypothetical protein